MPFGDGRQPDPRIVEKLGQEEPGMPEGSMVVASMAGAWVMHPDGTQNFWIKFDGDINMSTIIGDLFTAIQDLSNQRRAF